MPRVSRFWIERFEGVYLSQHRNPDFTQLNYFLNAFDHRIKTAVVGDPKFHFTHSAGGDNAIAFTHIHRHRLFAQHMLPCFRGGNRLISMQMNRRGDVNRVDFLITQ